ncbi:MAG: nucleoside recognition protein [Clostridia bacterium]|nr:nucleoside recognition protein [Clostridia bacterium]
MVEIIAKDAFFGTMSVIWGMFKVIIPLMIVIQIMRDYKALELISKKLSFISKFFGLSKDALFPLLIGFVIGISYGAGAVMEAAQESQLTKKDIFLIGIFLSCCHGFLETTLIFAVIGANVWVMTITRLLVAIVLTLLFSKFYPFKNTDSL